jgi:hypothetical protein
VFIRIESCLLQNEVKYEDIFGHLNWVPKGWLAQKEKGKKGVCEVMAK